MLNKKFYLFFILIFAFSLYTYSAKADICANYMEISENCTFITPSINCTSPTYTILNASSNATITSGTMQNFTSSIYRFNFTLNPGEYIIQLCDGTTRNVRVILPPNIELSTSECIDSSGEILFLSIIYGLCLLLIILAEWKKANIFGLMGALLFAYISRFLAACNSKVSLFLIIIGVLLAIYYIFKRRQ